jgi:CDP-diacylglycerol--serine O-phosphatidyltransferase
LHDLKSAGWIAALTFAICAALRLARFNVMIEDPNRPAWAGNYFVGVPAPAGAITVLLPIYVQFLGLPHFELMASVTFLYTLGIAFLMVSRLPVFSGKRVGKRVAPEMVLPVFVLIVLFFALLISYPWEVLTIGTVLYLMTLPLGWLSYRQALRKTAAAGAAPGAVNEATGPAAAVTPAGGPAAPSPPLAAEHPPASERPPRLN